MLDQNRVITPHPAFRLFATANTAGSGDSSGMYVGTQAINQAQLDRWSVIAQLDYLPAEQEQSILAAYAPQIAQSTLRQMVTFAGLCRRAQRQGDLVSRQRVDVALQQKRNVAGLGSGELHQFVDVPLSASQACGSLR